MEPHTLFIYLMGTLSFYFPSGPQTQGYFTESHLKSKGPQTSPSVENRI